MAEGDFVLVRTPSTATEEDKKLPWVAKVLKAKGLKIEVEWVAFVDGKWQLGLEGREKIGKSSVMAKFAWDGQGDLPHEEEIWKMGKLEPFVISECFLDNGLISIN